MAAVIGKEQQHSGWLRQGLATALAIVANHGGALALRVPYGTQQLTSPHRLVRAEF